MDNWLSELRDDLDGLAKGSLLRRLRPVQHRGRSVEVNGRRLLNFAGNDYLGLSTHPRVIDAAVSALREYGAGAGASRLVTGHISLHEQVERQFAAFKHAEAALITPTGFTANLAVMTALATPGDLICVDKLNHASLIDAARASGAEVRVFPHLQTAKLVKLLERHQAADKPPTSSRSEIRNQKSEILVRPSRRFIVTDSVFSMDGDAADLPALCDLADRLDAILVVDEAHGTGVLGSGGSGLCEVQGVTGRVDVVVSTASKAMGSLGGIVTARREVIETLVNRARSFIYTTAVPPGQAAAIGAAVEVIRDEPERRLRLAAIGEYFRREAKGLTWLAAPAPGGEPVTPIVPLIVGAPETALALAAHLESCGIYAPAIRPPTVAPGSARVRLTLRADLLDAEIEDALRAMRSFSPVS